MYTKIGLCAFTLTESNVLRLDLVFKYSTKFRQELCWHYLRECNVFVDLQQRRYEPQHQKTHLHTSLRKQTYSNIVNILTTKKWKFSDKNSDTSHTSGQNIDCRYSLEPPRRGGSNGYPQSMFLGWNKKYNVYPCKPLFYYIKVGFNGVNII